MKRMSALAIAMFIVLPVSTHAFSLDDAVMSYVNYLKSRITALEAENEELRALTSCDMPKLGAVKEVKVNKASLSYTVRDNEEEQDLVLSINGRFDSAFLIVKNESKYDLTTVEFLDNDVLVLNNIKKGKYTYTLTSKNGDGNTLEEGEIVVQ